MSARYDRITIRWYADFVGYRELSLDLNGDDQSDARMAHIFAIVDWWRQKEKARLATAAPSIGVDSFG